MLISKAKKGINWENLIALFAITLPLGRGLFNSAFGVLIAYWLYRVVTGGVYFKRKDLIFLIIVCGYYLFSALSLLYSDNIQYGLDKVLSQSFVLVFPLLFVSLRDEVNEKAYLKSFQGFMLSLAVVSILSIGKQLFGVLSGKHGLEALTQNSLSTAVVDNYFLGLSLLIAFGLITYSYIKLFKPAIKVRPVALEIGVVLVLAATLILLNSRNLIFLTASGVCLLFLVKSILRKKPIIFIRILLAMAAVISLNYLANPYFGEKMEEVVKYSQEGSRDRYWGGMRKSIWDCTIKVIQSDPIVGVGVGDQKDQLELCYKIYMHNRLLVENNTFNAHNIFLQIFLGTGLVGGILFLVSLGYLIQGAIRANNMYYLLFIGVFIIAGLTESYFERNLTMAFYSFFGYLTFFSKSSPAK